MGSTWLGDSLSFMAMISGPLDLVETLRIFRIGLTNETFAESTATKVRFHWLRTQEGCLERAVPTPALLSFVRVLPSQNHTAAINVL